MKTIFYLSILFVTVTMMSSCENELPFNINNNPPKLVMNALINAESTDNLLFLNFTSKENSTHVQNVTVEVRINGELKESLRPLPPETECALTLLPTTDNIMHGRKSTFPNALSK